ncbi:DUF484 family protein [Aerosticca soli]|uniref:DUF484 domain-containing protein n=1 Tax=Aerosticca soli TaxID=2010829 RepID=A0A2Z6E829_9GAMM|nr:DUF484 family protein [Aerosticca soli]MDI3261085.1 DUF484 family protein [Nevskiaceae bacterium]BBD81306.1 protein of unknown function DUF484 [Aerosticca soli]
MSDPLLAELPDAAAVAAFLERHPGFLAEHPELVARLEAGAPGVASLTAHQLKRLRERNAELERRQLELVRLAADNERLMQRVHALNVAMLRSATPALAVHGVIEALGRDFGLDPVRLLLFQAAHDLSSAPWLDIEPAGRLALPELAGLLAGDEPFVGRLGPARLERLFGEQAAQVRSVAVLPLGEDGLLALGSGDAGHFQPGMGTLFLKMIAATVGAALARARGTL